MKKIPFLLLTVLVLTLMSAGNKKHIANLKKNDLLLDGFAVNTNWSFSEVAKLLGGNGRITQKSTRVHTYDQVGINVYESISGDTALGKVVEIQFHILKNQDDPALPASLYKDKMILEGYKLDRQLVMHELQETLNKRMFQIETGVPHTLKYMRGDMYIYFTFNEKHTDLLNVSFTPIAY